MPEVTLLSPDLSRSVSALARAVVAAERSWSLCPGKHPTVRVSVDRVRTALTAAISGQALSFGVTPDTLVIEGIPVAADGPVAEAAHWLAGHRDLNLSTQFVTIADVYVEAVEPDAVQMDPLSSM